MTAGGYDPNQYPQGQQPYGQGGYPPPPPPQFGGPGGPGPGGQGGGVSIGDAFNYGFAKFKASPLPWISVVALPAVLVILLYAVTFAGKAGIAFLLYPLVVIATVLAVNLAIAGALREADGIRLSFDNLFQFKNLGQFVIAYILVAIATSVGLIACCVGSIVVAFFLMFTNFFVIDHNQDAITAIKSSFNLVKSNPGEYVLLALVTWALVAAGTAICGIGVLVTGPIAVNLFAYSFRRITGGRIA
jgi:uncharacterized membrane protein